MRSFTDESENNKEKNQKKRIKRTESKEQGRIRKISK